MTGTERGPADTRGFLTAEWRHIAILNYPADPALLTLLLPNGLELDLWGGQAFMSVVGLVFESPSVLGFRLPFSRRFEQVNLRFYVRRLSGSGWRRGVVFVREFVPYRSMAAAARLLHNQKYEFAHMRHQVRHENPEFRGQPSGCSPDERSASITVEYCWRRSGRWNRLGLTTTGPSRMPPEGSLQEFITERHWGYAGAGKGGALEFQVQRPAWLVSCGDGWLDCETARVYGEEFAGILSTRPESAFLAAGSAVVLGRGVRLRPLH